MRTSALFGKKNFRFLKFMVCPHRYRGRGWASAETEGSIFGDFAQACFMNDPLRDIYLLPAITSSSLELKEWLNPYP